MQNKFEENITRILSQKILAQEAEPLPGHEERFEMKLLRLKEERDVKRIPKWPFILLAAASVIGVIISIVVVEMNKSNALSDKTRLSEVSGEFAAVEDYYKDRLQLDYNSLNANDQNIQRFLKDVGILETEYRMLESALARNFHNERIAQAMVNNYKYRLQLMEQLHKYIEIQNKINTQSHDEKLSS